MLSRKISTLLLVYSGLLISIPQAKPLGIESDQGRALPFEQPGTVTRKIYELDNLDPLRRLFQRDRGKVRLVALISPT